MAEASRPVAHGCLRVCTLYCSTIRDTRRTLKLRPLVPLPTFVQVLNLYRLLGSYIGQRQYTADGAQAQPREEESTCAGEHLKAYAGESHDVA